MYFFFLRHSTSGSKGLLQSRTCFCTALLVVFGFSIAGSRAAKAQDHLEPEDGSLAEYDFDLEYHTALRRHLLQGTEHYAAMMICLPSSSPEWAVILQKNETQNKWTLELRVSDEQIWGARRPDNIKVTKKSAPIDAKTAENLHKLWQAVLRKVKHPSKSQNEGLDGVSFHFSSSMPPDGILAGQCWSSTELPKPNTKNNNLIIIGNLMRQFVEASPDKRRSIVDLLSARLQEAEAQDRG